MNNLQLGRLGRNILVMYGFQILTLVAGTCLHVFLARTLGPADLGVYQLSILLPVVLGSLLTLGIPAANVYFIGRGDVSLGKALSLSVIVGACLSAGGIAVSAVALALSVQQVLPGVPLTFALAGLIILPLVLLKGLLASLLQAKQEFWQLGLAWLASPAIGLVAAVLLVWAFQLGPFGALCAYAIAEGSSLAIVCFGLSFGRRARNQNQQSQKYFRAALNYGWKAHLGNVVQLLNYRADIFLVNLFFGTVQTGLYLAAVVIVETVGMFSQAVSQVLFPRLAEMREDEELQRRLTATVFQAVLVATASMAIVVAAMSEVLISLLFGAEFGEARTALLWLLPGIVALAVARVLANGIAAKGRPGLNLVAAAVGFVFNIAGNLLLIPRWGITGAAISSTLAYTVITILTLAFHSVLTGDAWWRVFFLRPADVRLLWHQIPGAATPEKLCRAGQDDEIETPTMPEHSTQARSQHE